MINSGRMLLLFSIGTTLLCLQIEAQWIPRKPPNYYREMPDLPEPQGSEVQWINCPQYRCEDNGKCIYNYNVCDGKPDCRNGEDEELCAFDCGPQTFECNTPYLDNYTCIPDDRVCDTKVDCPHGEDESQASCDAKHCPPNAFKCEDGLSCTKEDRVCDTIQNCNDGSDEFNCSLSPTGWPCYDWFPCFEYAYNVPHCYNPNKSCDGFLDCSNGLDETNCSQSTNSSRPLDSLESAVNRTVTSVTSTTTVIDSVAMTSSFKQVLINSTASLKTTSLTSKLVSSTSSKAISSESSIDFSSQSPNRTEKNEIGDDFQVTFESTTWSTPNSTDKQVFTTMQIAMIIGSGAVLLTVVIVIAIVVTMRCHLKKQNVTNFNTDRNNYAVSCGSKSDGLQAEAAQVKLLEDVTSTSENGHTTEGIVKH